MGSRDMGSMLLRRRVLGSHRRLDMGSQRMDNNRRQGMGSRHPRQGMGSRHRLQGTDRLLRLRDMDKHGRRIQVRNIRVMDSRHPAAMRKLRLRSGIRFRADQ
jgi:hypothetical protein